MSERSARLSVLVNSPAWPLLIAVIHETVDGMKQKAMEAPTDEEAAKLFLRARIAFELSSLLVIAVENAAQGE